MTLRVASPHIASSTAFCGKNRSASFPRSDRRRLVGKNFLWMYHDKHAVWVVTYHLYAPINLVCRNISLDNWACKFTNILLDNLSSSICRHILVGFKIIDNQ